MRLLVILAMAAGFGCQTLSVTPHALDGGFLLLEGGGGNTVVFSRAQTTVVFDTKEWPFDAKVKQAVEAAHPDRLIVINSHAHIDHTGGDRLFPNALIIAAPDTIHELEANAGDFEIPPGPGWTQIALSKSMEIRVGDELLLMVHPPAAHTSGDLFAWLPNRGLLLTGDLFDHGYYPHVDESRGGSFVGLIAALKQLAEYPASLVIPGHGAQATRADILVNLRLLESIRHAVEADRKLGLDDEAIVAEQGSIKDEGLSDLGPFSSREKVVRGFLHELPR